MALAAAVFVGETDVASPREFHQQNTNGCAATCAVPSEGRRDAKQARKRLDEAGAGRDPMERGSRIPNRERSNDDNC